MTGLASINAHLVEALYAETLVLADAVRGGFDAMRHAHPAPGDGGAVDGSAVEFACEGLRTTTRLMHCLAWLLNHRAWFAGEISAVQLRRHGRLVSHYPASDPAIVARLPAPLAGFVQHSERLYARLQRLDAAWRGALPAPVGAIERLRERLAIAGAAG